MIQHNYNTTNPTIPAGMYGDPISRIEAERKASPMAQIVARTKQQPIFA